MGSFPFAVPQLHCVSLKILPQGKREKQLPSEGRPSEVEKGSIRQSGSRKCSCAGRKGQQRKREREGWKFRVKLRIPLLGGVLGNWVPHFPPSPLGALRALRVPRSVWPGHLAGEAAAEEVSQNPDAEVGLWGRGLEGSRRSRTPCKVMRGPARAETSCNHTERLLW